MATKKEYEEKQKLLIEIIKRFDLYINSTNTKIAIILSYCTVCFIGIGIRFATSFHKESPQWYFYATFIVFIILTSYIIKIAYNTLYPDTNPGHSEREKQSIFFFSDVASFDGGRDAYKEKIFQITAEEIVDDLSGQAFILANIANDKFKMLQKIIKWVVLGHLPLVLLFVILSFLSIK